MAFAGLERALTATHRAHQQWLVHCVAAAGLHDAGALEATLLHHFAGGDGEAGLCSLGEVLALHDGPLLRAVLHKLTSRDVLARHGGVDSPRYALGAEGAVLARRYLELRRACLLQGAPDMQLAQPLQALAAHLATSTALVASL